MYKRQNEHYGQSNKARHFQAQKEVSCISQGDLDIVSYFNKAKKVWDEFTAVNGIHWCDCKKCECDVNGRLQNYLQEQKIIQFLMGLNESYTTVRGNILMMTPLPSLSQIYSLLVQEEGQRQVRGGLQFPSESTSFNVNTSANKGGNAVKGSASRRLDGKRSNLFCEHCKRSGHIVDRCNKIHGYPDNTNSRQGGRGRFHKTTNNAWGECEGQSESVASTPPASSPSLLPELNQEQSKQLLAFLSNLTSSTEAKSGDATVSTTHMAGICFALNAMHNFCTFSQDTWIIDLGASEHMCSRQDSLQDLRA